MPQNVLTDPFSPAFSPAFGSGAVTPDTAESIITDSLEMLGVYGPGDQISAADLARGLRTLNAMLDSWSNESLTCFAWQRNQFTLVVNQGWYTVGPGGNINIVRPLRISDAAGAAYLLDTNNNKYPMDVVDQMSWNLRTTASVNSNLPDTLYYNPEYPLGKLGVWPTPNMSYECYFYSYAQLAGFAALTTEAQFPPGYYLAITTNLAILLKPYFRDAQIDPLIIKSALDSKGNVKRNNMRTQIAVFDPEIVARGQNTYNIRTDRNYFATYRRNVPDRKRASIASSLRRNSKVLL